MRIAVGLLACFGAGALTTTLADPPNDVTPAAATAPGPAAPAASTAAAATTQAASSAATTQAAPASANGAIAKAPLDSDTRHFLALGYKPEKHGGELIYCHKETELGSRLSQVKNCGTIEELKLQEQNSRSGVAETQRKQVGIQNH